MNNLTSNILAFGLGQWEIVLIIIVILLLFGGKKLPELARGVAKGMKTFKHEMHEVKTEFKKAADEADKEHEEKKNETKEDK